VFEHARKLRRRRWSATAFHDHGNAGARTYSSQAASSPVGQLTHLARSKGLP
jgi:hypothetical protein